MPLYPEIDTYNNFLLKVSDLHEIYVEEAGNPKGKPVIYLHGGPGSKIKPKYRQFFNPEKYRIILFDQRGCGRSTPYGEIKENTTWELVEDMEKIREHLEIEKWMVFGGSWGSTLALAYAEKYSDRVTELFLRGVFTLRKEEVDWLCNGGPRQIFPDTYEKLINIIPEKERSDLLSAFYHRIFSTNEQTSLEASKHFAYWDDKLMKLIVDDEDITNDGVDANFIGSQQIAFHYFKNYGFLEEGQLIRDATKLKDIPGVIIQGRYDMITPMKTAWDLHKVWKKADFEIIPNAGHHSSEEGILEKIIEYTDKFVQ